MRHAVPWITRVLRATNSSWGPTLAILLLSGVYGVSTPEEGRRILDGMQDELSRSRVLEGLALNIRTFYECMQGAFDEARRLIDLMDEISEALGQRSIVAFHLDRLGELELLAGDPAAAERAYRRQFEILDELGDEGTKSSAAAKLAHVLCALERFDDAERYAASRGRSRPRTTSWRMLPAGRRRLW